MATYGPDMEGRTAISKDGKSRLIIRNGEAVVDHTFQGGAGGADGASGPAAKTTSDDRKALQAANAQATAERDARRRYHSVSSAISKIDGPFHARRIDALTPQEGDGILGTIGGLIGSIPYVGYDDNTRAAMDQLRTVGSQSALNASSDLKGAASDKDMALMRMSGIGPYKEPVENRRILNDAFYQSELEGLRARLTSSWIAKNGSLSAPSKSGETFENYLNRGETRYGERFNELQSARKPGLPKPPPSRKAQGGSQVTIDLEGNIVR